MSRKIRGCVIILLLLSLDVQALQDESQPRFRATTNLTLVDARVLDRSGRPIRGLKAEDFSLREEGVVQKISYFQEVDLPLDTTERLVITPSVHAESDPLGPGPALDAPPPPEKRLLILLFNFANASLQDTLMMRESARSFLEREFDSNDAAAVLVFDGGLSLLTDFTSDRSALAGALRSLSGVGEEYNISSPEEESSDSTFVADETEFALFTANQDLAAIQSIADAFRTVPGRKALVYFSTGLTSQGLENDEQMRWTTDLCNRANISVYPVDARGLVALSPGGGAHRAGPRGTGIFTGRSSLNELAALSRSQEGLMTLAADTGGVALIDDNDLSKIFRKAREDASHYYLLGYYAPPAARDGRFRRIDVQVRVANARVNSRKGYYSDKPFRRLADSEREFLLLQSIVQNTPYSDFPLRMSAEFFPGPATTYYVPVLLSFDHAELRERTGDETLDLEIVLLARDQRGVNRAGVRDRLEIRKRSNEEPRYVYENLLSLDPGKYELIAYVRDNRTGLLSRASHSLEVPQRGSLAQSSLVLAGAWKDPGVQQGYRIKKGNVITVVSNPLLVGNRVLIPRVDGIFAPGETLFAHASLRSDCETGVRHRVILRGPKGDSVHIGDWKTVADSGAGFQVSLRLPLVGLDAGEYRLFLEVDHCGGDLVRLGSDFEVRPNDSQRP